VHLAEQQQIAGRKTLDIIASLDRTSDPGTVRATGQGEERESCDDSG
jgi:hypothetical protein